MSSDKSGENDVSSSRVVGMQLGEFTLLRRLGKGGMAEVWLAEQTSLKRNVALKLLRSELMEDDSYVKRFQTEAKAAAGLNHSNIVQVYTVGCEKGQHFIAQEYVHGQTLKALLQKRGPLDLPLALMMMRQVAAALQEAGSRGIVHRDIKPENIMITRKGEVKVADFGLAQLQGGERLNLTQEGVTMGTPLYMSPEQVSGHAVDQRSDIYSFGITCYHMLTGAPPFRGENAVSVAVKHLHEHPQSLGEVRADLPAAVCQMVERMIAKRPEDRYGDAGTIVNDVRKLAKAIRTGESVDDLIGDAETTTTSPVRRPIPVLAGMCLLVFLVTSGIGWYSRASLPPPGGNALSDVPVFPTAREQYIHAMFATSSEDAFRAVISRFPARDDKHWTRLAHQQLALLLMKDRRREKEAREQLDELQRVEPEDRELIAQARVGKAYLDAIHNNVELARRTVQGSSGDELNQVLTGSWKQLFLEVRQLTSSNGTRTSPQ